jgi:hypothetical protein
MLGSEAAMTNPKTSLIEGLGFGVLPLGVIEFRQVVEVPGDIRMGSAEGCFINSERPLKEGLGVGVFPLAVIQARQVVES